MFIVVETNDCHKTYQGLEAKGVKFFEEPEEQPRGIGMAF